MLSRSLALLTITATLPLCGAEFVLFTSGARLQADRHERVGNVIRIYHGGGVSEVPANVVAEFEQIELDPAPEPPPPAAGPNVEVPVELPPSNDPIALIRAAAIREGLPPEFVASVAKVESALRPDAISPKGAIGIMQLMPATAQALGADPHDLRQNIEAGTRLLRELLVKYDGDVVKALSAYNAGTGAVERYQGMPPYDETRRYVNKVIGAYQKATPVD